MSTDTRRIPYVRLGSSGLKVSKIILGCKSYGSPNWRSWVLPEQDSIQHIKAAYDAGINTFDTANLYSNGLSEVVLGKAIKQLNLPRPKIVVMTKIFGVVSENINETIYHPTDADHVGPGYVNQHGLSRKHIFDSVKLSLQRLQLDYIDVLQCHRFDPETPIGETMQALHDVVRAGYVRYLGMSSCYAWQFHAMQNYATNNNLTPFISMQNHYNLLYREEEREMFPTLKFLNVGSIPFSPLACGLLNRPLDAETIRGQTNNLINGYSNRGIPDIIDAIKKIAATKGVSPAQISLAWVMSKSGVTAPIVNTTSVENLYDLLGAVDIHLSDEEVEELEKAYEPQASSMR